MAISITRREFIESHGATCKNWQWSWSFINARKRIVIFGAWDRNQAGSSCLILDEDWGFRRSRKQPGYAQAREHIRKVEEKDYRLLTFPMKYSNARAHGGVGPATIGEFEPTLTECSLARVGTRWYAVDNKDGFRLPDEVDSSTRFFQEGSVTQVLINAYERNAKARTACLNHYGYACAVCAFDFERVYGSLGRQFIHVHHVKSLAEIGRRYTVDPIRDLVPVCPNCHAMLHLKPPTLTVSQLKQRLKSAVRRSRI